MNMEEKFIKIISNDEIIKIDSEILELEKTLKKLPGGKLLFSHNERRVKWYVRDNNETVYVPKSDRNRAEKLAYRKYIETKILMLTKKKKLLNGDYKAYCLAREKFNNLLEDRHFVELLKPFNIVNHNEDAWAKEKYITNMNHLDNRIHSTVGGLKVRSKSESIIAMALSNNGIAFRYECELIFSGYTIYPDFTIKHPVSGEILYWEHLGMMDDIEYETKAKWKISKYVSEGIYPMDKLILTYETINNPLDYGYAEKIIKSFLS